MLAWNIVSTDAFADATEDIRRADELYAAGDFKASVKFLSRVSTAVSGVVKR